jgi:hypothetical protein
MLAEMLEAADRRINVLTREVERSIGARTQAPDAGHATPAHVPPTVAPVSVRRLKLPAIPLKLPTIPLKLPAIPLRLPEMPDVRAAASRLTARWWRHGSA